MISRTPVLGRFIFVNVWFGMVGAVMFQSPLHTHFSIMQALLRALTRCDSVA